MSVTIPQNAEYTFKANQQLGRHGWLRLTPAYGVKLVEKLLVNAHPNEIILDPFSGVGTTGLVAAEYGYRAIACDINPFLIWFANVKCQNYCHADLVSIRHQVETILKSGQVDRLVDAWVPELFNIHRWWPESTVKVLSALRLALVNQFGEPTDHGCYGLVWVAFCRLVIETSAAAFNHVSMSFKEQVICLESDYIKDLFLTILEFILETAGQQISGNVTILNCDARQMAMSNHQLELDGISINRVITSPPYPNRISYIRELRPYMYWTKFLTLAKDAGELDWLAIGGTWGIATSRLFTWELEESNLPNDLFSTVEKIRSSDGKNALLLSTYVLKYFHDMHLHLKSIRTVLNQNAVIHYIVGNSTFFGIMVDTPKLLMDSMRLLGYSQIELNVIRKRNCNKKLYEYCISARWSTG